jgi:hypothetical protein
VYTEGIESSKAKERASENLSHAKEREREPQTKKTSFTNENIPSPTFPTYKVCTTFNQSIRSKVVTIFPLPLFPTFLATVVVVISTIAKPTEIIEFPQLIFPHLAVPPQQLVTFLLLRLQKPFSELRVDQLPPLPSLYAETQSAREGETGRDTDRGRDRDRETRYDS